MKTIILIVILLLALIAMYFLIGYLEVILVSPKKYCGCGTRMAIKSVDLIHGKVTYICPHCQRTKIVENFVY
jgi:hypothetical protein